MTVLGVIELAVILFFAAYVLDRLLLSYERCYYAKYGKRLDEKELFLDPEIEVDKRD